MKIIRKCKKCGSWAKPEIKFSYTKKEFEDYQKFFEENYAQWNQGKMYFPFCPGGNEKNKGLVIPAQDAHPCTICAHGEKTPGALSCQYAQCCAALAYFYLCYSQEWSEKQAEASIFDFGVKFINLAGKARVAGIPKDGAEIVKHEGKIASTQEDKKDTTKQPVANNEDTRRRK